MTMGDRFPEVLRAARLGKSWALEAIYRDLSPVVLGYLRGRGAIESEDAAAEVFVGVVRGLRSFRGDEGAFRAWVFSIAHRRMIDQRRRTARRREDATDPSEMAGSLAALATGDAEAEALERLGSSWALRAISGLTEDQRDVLLMRVLADLSVADVARVTGKTEGAVKALQRRALLALGEQIEREGVT